MSRGPNYDEADDGPDDVQRLFGIALRDLFAAAALAGDLANAESTTDMKTRAEWCYSMADAMMEARK